MIRDWRDNIRVGDVLLIGRKHRIVRAVSYSRHGCLKAVSLVILRRSWTNRPYTTIGRADLKTRNARPTGVRHHFKAGSIDVTLWREMRQHPFTLTADDVISAGMR